MLGCSAHVRVIALPHVRCACESACRKGLELCVRKCVRMGNFSLSICDRTFLLLCLSIYHRKAWIKFRKVGNAQNFFMQYV